MKQSARSFRQSSLVIRYAISRNVLSWKQSLKNSSFNSFALTALLLNLFSSTAMRSSTSTSAGGAALARDRQNATGFVSQPIARRPFNRLSNIVVPRPQNGSSTISSGFDQASKLRRTKVSGNIAKYGQIEWKR